MSLTIDEAIARFEANAEQNERWASGGLNPEANAEYAAEHRQLAEWLRELQERRKEPEIVECYECKHYTPVSQSSNSWGKCSVHSSPTEKQRTCQSCDYCSWAERKTE